MVKKDNATTQKDPARKVKQKPEKDAGAKEKAAAVQGKYFYAVGRRKSATATVRLYPKGKGNVVINDKDWKDYFPVAWDQTLVEKPLVVVSVNGKVDATIRVQGGGVRGQIDAIRLGFARALIKWQEDLKPVLKKQGLLTRDSRVKERKKPGLKRARRAPQWQKR